MLENLTQPATDRPPTPGRRQSGFFSNDASEMGIIGAEMGITEPEMGITSEMGMLTSKNASKNTSENAKV